MTGPARTFIGRRRRRLVLEAPSETPDGAGGATRSYSAVATVWASVEAVETSAGGERWRADRPELATRLRVVMRWRADLDGGKRLRDGARLFAIVSAADPDGRRRHSVCIVEEVTP